jgi:hypothetical protein
VESPVAASRTLRAAVALPGRLLGDQVPAHREGRLGHDFSRVRLHADPTVAAAADAIPARACTIGGDVIFAAGQYRPETTAGRELLAHDMIDVARRGPGPERMTGQVAISDTQDTRERHAAAMSSGAQPALARSRTPHRRARCTGSSELGAQSPVTQSRSDRSRPQVRSF